MSSLKSDIIDNLFDSQLAHRQPLATTFLSNAILKGRLAHAYLFSGRSKIANFELAKGLAAYLNCTQKTPVATSGGNATENLHAEHLSCAFRHGGKELADAMPLFCQNCRWILSDKHPQAFLKLDNEGSKSGRIAVEKTRLLTEELSKESQYTRVIFVRDAHQEVLHRPAANAILKTIEDPRSAVVFMLFSVRSEDVLPTIVSRCQVIPTRNEDFQSVTFAAASNAVEKNKHRRWHTALNTQDSDEKVDEEFVVILKAVAEKLSLFSPQNGHHSAAVPKHQAALIFLEIAKELQKLHAEGGDGEWLLDAMLEEEVERFSLSAISSAKVSKYLDRLIKLAEDSKLNFVHYVSPKAVIESFCLGWCQLKTEFRLW